MRTLALGLVLLIAFIVVAPTLRAYLTQREQMRRLDAELATVTAGVTSLDAELRRWSDPGYVAAQARERLAFVRPGEVAYRVIDPETVVGRDAAVGDLRGLTESVGSAPDVPWYLTLWDSVVDAGEADVAGEAVDSGAGGDAPTGPSQPSGGRQG